MLTCRPTPQGSDPHLARPAGVEPLGLAEVVSWFSGLFWPRSGGLLTGSSTLAVVLAEVIKSARANEACRPILTKPQRAVQVIEAKEAGPVGCKKAA
jgi:hypothetical protein